MGKTCEKGDDKTSNIASNLLVWYDKAARDLPWRVAPAARKNGITPNPYHVWLSEVMLQQTTVATVQAYFLRLTQRWPRINDLAAADEADVMAEWAGLGYYARARNMHACARVILRDYGGEFPETRAELIKLPGIGPYTAAAIAAIAFDQAEVVVDGNIERVMARLFNEQTPLPKAKPLLTSYAANLTPVLRPGCYAQALMDLGARVCTPRSPACNICPIMAHCAAYKANSAAELPRKSPKSPKPIRRCIIFIAKRSDGAWLMERRPPKGLLGGTLGWPTSDWVAKGAPLTNPPITAQWRKISTGFRHTFTHFHLEVKVQRADVPQGANPERGTFVAASEFNPEHLPTLMRKAYELL